MMMMMMMMMIPTAVDNSLRRKLAFVRTYIAKEQRFTDGPSRQLADNLQTVDV